MYCFVTDVTWDDYLDRMARDGEWGDHLIIRYVSSAGQCADHVTIKYDSREREWGRSPYYQVGSKGEDRGDHLIIRYG